MIFVPREVYILVGLEFLCFFAHFIFVESIAILLSVSHCDVVQSTTVCAD